MFSDLDPEEEWDEWLRAKANAMRASASHVLVDFDRNLVRYSPSLNAAFNERGGFNERLLKYKSLQELQYLLGTRCVDPNQNDRGFNALSFAATQSVEQQACFSLLLQRNANVNSQAIDYHLHTPLHLLIHHNNPEVAVFFIKTAADYGIFINFSLPDRDNCTTLLLAAKKGYEKLAMCILEYSKAPEVFINLRDDEGKKALDYAQDLSQTQLIEKLKALSDQSKTVWFFESDSAQIYTPGFDSARYEPDQDACFIDASGARNPTQSIIPVVHQVFGVSKPNL